MSLQQRIHGSDGHDDSAALQSRIGTTQSDRLLDRFAELRSSLHSVCVTKVGPELGSFDDAPEELRKRVRWVVESELSRRTERLTTEERARLVEAVVDDVLGYGPIDPFLRDPSITEIMVNGHEHVYVERAGLVCETDVRFASEDHLLRVIDRIVSGVGRRVDEASPMVDARLPDGSRVNVILPPVALQGPVLTIRKFSVDALTAENLMNLGSITPELVDVLAACVRGKLNMLISGGTGVGKTTLLNILSSFIPNNERIITIEDAAELQLQQSHVVSLESRPANIEGQGEVRIRELVRNALRMRPDRIIVGEVRGAETVDMLQAMNTGHEGSLTTIHANSPRDALSRLETLVLTAGVELPLRAIREQIASAFDVVVQISRGVDGTRRVTHVTEVLRMESDVVTLQEIFSCKPIGGAPGAVYDRPLPTGIRPQFTTKLADNGVTISPETFDPTPAAYRLQTVGGGRVG
ncbi:MAG TPA: CpaF family protein [Gaiellaceae bacterium]|nr:CpaF family protein [Gaiellaceae bacterium]